MSVKVSVVIPAYNRAHTIGRALDSLIAQSHENWEALVVDDGSSDGIVRVVEAYGDPRIRLFVHEENRGRNSARNTAFDAMTGDWFAFLDSDDELAPEALSRVLEATGGYRVNTVHCHKTDTATGLNVSGGYPVGLIPPMTMCDGETWFMIRSDVLEKDRFIEGLNGPESELWMRVIERQERCFIEDALYLWHTEGDDRMTKAEMSDDSTRESVYRSFAKILDVNPSYFAMRRRVGLSDALPGLVQIFIAHGDAERAVTAAAMVLDYSNDEAERLYLCSSLYGLPQANQLLRRCAYLKVVRTENMKRGIVRVLRALRLRPPAPESECALNATDYEHDEVA